MPMVVPDVALTLINQIVGAAPSQAGDMRHTHYLHLSMPLCPMPVIWLLIHEFLIIFACFCNVGLRSA